MPLLSIIHHHSIGLHAAVGADDESAMELAVGGVERLVIFTCTGKLPAKWYHLWIPFSFLGKLIDRE